MDQPCIKCETPCVQRPCNKWPLKNVASCAAHGGNNARSKNANLEREAEADIEKLLRIEGHVEPVHDPYSFLAQLAGEMSLIKTQLGQKVQDLPSLEDAGSERVAAQIHVVMAAYERFLTHCGKIATDMSRLDLDSRIAKLSAAIDNETAAIVSTALSGALAKSSLPVDERESVLREFGNLLRTQESQKVAITA